MVLRTSYCYDISPTYAPYQSPPPDSSIPKHLRGKAVYPYGVDIYHLPTSQATHASTLHPSPPKQHPK